MTVLSQSDLVFIEDYIDNYHDNDRIRLYKNYSGRAMYGNHCFGFSLDEGVTTLGLFADWLEFIINFDFYDSDDDVIEGVALVTKLMQAARTDSLGLGTIVYFPSYDVPPDFMLEEED